MDLVTALASYSSKELTAKHHAQHVLNNALLVEHKHLVLSRTQLGLLIRLYQTISLNVGVIAQAQATVAASAKPKTPA